MAKRVIYNGQDPNMRGRVCDVVKREGDMVTLVTSDDILGRIEFKVDKNRLKKF